MIAGVLFIAGVAQSAEIYRWVDDQGNVVFSDQPPKDGAGTPPRKLNLSPIQTVPALTAPEAGERAAPVKEAQASVLYTEFRIIQPAADASIRENAGDVTLVMAISPPLNVQAGHQIHLYVDNQLIAQGETLSHTVQNMDRGTHTVSAQVKNTQGQTLATAESIRFTLHRHSRLF